MVVITLGVVPSCDSTYHTSVNHTAPCVDERASGVSLIPFGNFIDSQTFFHRLGLARYRKRYIHTGETVMALYPIAFKNRTENLLWIQILWNETSTHYWELKVALALQPLEIFQPTLNIYLGRLELPSLEWWQNSFFQMIWNKCGVGESKKMKRTCKICSTIHWTLLDNFD